MGSFHGLYASIIAFACFSRFCCVPINDIQQQKADTGNIFSETLVECLEKNNLSSVLRGSLESFLEPITSENIDQICQNFVDASTCAHEEVTNLQGVLNPDHEARNETVAKYHALYYACTTGRELFSDRSHCSQSIDQEAVFQHGQCSVSPKDFFDEGKYQEAIKGKTKEELEVIVNEIKCKTLNAHFNCTRDRTRDECSLSAHHLNLNVWKIASNYFEVINRCQLDINEETMFPPSSEFPNEPLQAAGGQIIKDVAVVNNDDSGVKKLRISDVITVEAFDIDGVRIR